MQERRMVGSDNEVWFCDALWLWIRTAHHVTMTSTRLDVSYRVFNKVRVLPPSFTWNP